MVLGALGSVSGLQSDIDFYVRVVDRAHIPKIDVMRKELFRSFAENDKDTEKTRGYTVSENKEEVKVGVQDDISEEINTPTEDLKAPVESQNTYVVLDFDEDGWAYSPIAEENEIGKRVEDDENPKKDTWVEEDEDDEVPLDWEDDEDEDSLDWSEGEEEDEEEVLEESLENSETEDSMVEVEEENESDEDEEDTFPEWGDEDDDEVDSDFLSNDEDEEVEEDDVTYDSDDDEEFEEDEFPDWGDDEDEEDEGNTIESSISQKGIVQEPQEETLQEKPTIATRGTFLNGGYDDSWRKESEVGQIKNLWSFDDMEDASDDFNSDMLYKAMSKVEDMVKEEIGVSKNRDITSFKSLKKTAEISEREIEEERVRQEATQTQEKEEPERVAPKQPVYSRSDYKSLRDFVKVNRNCTISDALAVFSKKEIEKEIKMGRVYQRKNKLFI